MTTETLPDYRKNPVLAAHAWKSNAELIVDCRRLGYLNDEDLVLDPTHGKGVWWKLWRPAKLVSYGTGDGVDFRALPEADGRFDVVMFDPPYVCTGGRDTSKLPDFLDRYGLRDAPRTPQGLQELMNDGLAEMHRVVRPPRRHGRHKTPGGLILMKCQDYVWSGALWTGTYYVHRFAVETLGLEVVDRLEHHGRVRAQPPRTRKDGRPVVQQHARRNLSTLFVFRRTAP